MEVTVLFGDRDRHLELECLLELLFTESLCQWTCLLHLRVLLFDSSFELAYWIDLVSRAG
jgi:hypothetical protein